MISSCMMRMVLACIGLFFATAATRAAAQEPAGGGPAGGGPAGGGIEVTAFQPVKPLSRAGRPAGIAAVIRNTGDVKASVVAELKVPAGVRCTTPATAPAVVIEPWDECELEWEVVAEEAGEHAFGLEVRTGDTSIEAALTVLFLPAVEMQKLPYIPEPEPVETEILIGAHHCPLWEADKPEMWAQLLKHPERTPALGFYAQENPEVSDWETKWAVEHGVSFFIYCWYRASQGGPVETRFSSAIHEALFKSRFVDKMKFTIMWENQRRGFAGVADEQDLKENLFPYWMENYFTHPSYLKVDNKPVLFIYRPEFLVDDLGSEENVVKAFDWMRQACRDAGFDGLCLLGEYRGLNPEHLGLMKRLGLDYSFAYCWHVGNSPTPEQAIAAQEASIAKTQELGILPQVVTLSQAWSGWHDEGSIWKIPPEEYKTLLEKGKAFVESMPGEGLGSRMLLLDNWNEWGEGHYIAPYREYGFGYLDAVREVFSKAPEPHIDLIPEDIGLGPYDTAYAAYRARDKNLGKLRTQRVRKAGVPEEGLIGWWAFDEKDDAPVALDYSGHRFGAILYDGARAPGVDGSALVCRGGCGLVDYDPALSPESGLTVACWVKTDETGQSNQWFVNHVFSGGTQTGYRMGLVDDKPTFEVPQTSWSHHLKAPSPLPTGRWVHLAGTFDGKTMRLYVDGVEQATMDRPGPVNGNQFPLCLGSYAKGHWAHFKGLLDEVLLYGRALSPAEVGALAGAGETP
ncbi:MAG: glycoside hydrolase family 99-like domain-containing protein [Candidatus Hydrogenedentes bacterium]|nr:glycoside hydrolase family 99-like domain-containing protein [Candidatus Hydrogenedentota bacterium]